MRYGYCFIERNKGAERHGHCWSWRIGATLPALYQGYLACYRGLWSQSSPPLLLPGMVDCIFLIQICSTGVLSSLFVSQLLSPSSPAKTFISMFSSVAIKQPTPRAGIFPSKDYSCLLLFFDGSYSSSHYIIIIFITAINGQQCCQTPSWLCRFTRVYNLQSLSVPTGWRIHHLFLSLIKGTNPSLLKSSV